MKLKMYAWKDAPHPSLDAQVVGDTLEQIEVDRGLTPEAIVEEATPPDSPLHPAFEWDEAKAAHSYRIHQARGLVRCLIVTQQPEKGPPATIRAFASVSAEKGRRYVSTISALTDEGLKQEILASALSELKSFRRKYNDLRELARVLDAIDELSLEFDA